MGQQIRSTFSKIKSRFNEKMTSVSNISGDLYFCQLPEHIGYLSTLILKLFYSGIKVNQAQTRHLIDLNKNGTIVYATKHKSNFLYLFSYIRYKLDKLPFPQIGLDYSVVIWQPMSRAIRIFLSYLSRFFQNLSLPDPYESGYIRQELLNGRPALLSLIEKKGFYRRFVKEKIDPVKYLIEVQKTTERPIYIIPQLMFFDKHPQKSLINLIDILFGTKENPGKLRRLIILFRNPGKVFVELSEPFNLKEFLAAEENREQSTDVLSLSLRRILLIQINRHRQSITGPALKTRDEMKEDVLTGERLQNFIEHYSETRNVPIQTVRKEANAFLDEISAKYNMVIIKTASVLITWILNTMYDGVTVNEKGLEKIKRMSKRGPLILIPCHKSHIDYLILSYLLYHNNMPCPHVAAGKNLSFWPLGPLFRGGGAFFIRRSFRGAILYSKVFAEYIHNLLSEGFNIEFFIEGGRSRTGKLILPKLGLLSILLNSYKNNACEDMILAPIYIGYDRIIEESSYINEIEGEQKKPESFMQVVKARKFLNKRYGRIYIQFHEPISLKELLEHYGSPIEEMTSKEFNILCRNLGHRVINAINNVSVVTPHALVAAAAMNCSKKSFTYEHFLSHVETYMNYLFLQKAKLADTLLIDHVHAVEHAFENYIQRKFIERITTDKEDPLSDSLFMVNESKRPHLEYYKNNCISFFVPGAIAALAILVRDAFQFSASDLRDDYEFLQYFFKYEFAYDVDLSVDRYVRKILKAFIDDAIIMPHPTLPDTYNLTSSGFRKLKLFSSFLKTYFESYWVVLNFFMQTHQNSTDPKERLKKIEAIGNRMFKQKTIERKEALSRINYGNGIDFFTTNGVKGLEDKDKIEYYADAMQKYMNYI